MSDTRPVRDTSERLAGRAGKSVKARVENQRLAARDKSHTLPGVGGPNLGVEVGSPLMAHVRDHRIPAEPDDGHGQPRDGNPAAQHLHDEREKAEIDRGNRPDRRGDQHEEDAGEGE